MYKCAHIHMCAYTYSMCINIKKPKPEIKRNYAQTSGENCCLFLMIPELHFSEQDSSRERDSEGSQRHEKPIIFKDLVLASEHIISSRHFIIRNMLKKYPYIARFLPEVPKLADSNAETWDRFYRFYVKRFADERMQSW